MRRWLAFVLAAVLPVGMPTAAGSLAAAACSVQNARTTTTSDTLQEAVDASTKGDTLLIQGTCVGGTAILHTKLLLKGVPTLEQPMPTLDGGAVGRVLLVRARVVLQDLTITNGRAWRGGGIRLRGSGARLSLKGDTSVTGNSAKYVGGGIFTTLGTLTMNDTSSVSANTTDAGGSGGGISNGSFGTVTMNDTSSVSGNTALHGGGIDNHHTLTLNGSSSVSGNDGGGIANHLILTLNGSSSVNGNAGVRGGGIANYSQGTLTMNDASSVSGNTARLEGGGIYNSGYGSAVILNDTSSVSGNAAGLYGGGGIFNEYRGNATLNGSSSVSGNTAGEDGGGIFNYGDVTLNDSSSVSGNTADADDTDEGTGGGVLAACFSTLTGAVDGGNVNDNYLGTVAPVEDNIAYKTPCPP